MYEYDVIFDFSDIFKINFFYMKSIFFSIQLTSLQTIKTILSVLLEKSKFISKWCHQINFLPGICSYWDFLQVKVYHLSRKVFLDLWLLGILCLVLHRPKNNNRVKLYSPFCLTKEPLYMHSHKLCVVYFLGKILVHQVSSSHSLSYFLLLIFLYKLSPKVLK